MTNPSNSENDQPPTASNQERDPRQDAGQDKDITSRLERNPENVQAQLDEALDETMDASDPVSLTAPSQRHLG